MYYARGSSYPKSSAQNMSSGMARSVLDHGGDAVCNAQVTEIVLDDAGDACGVRVKKSTSAEGSETVTIRAKNVVNAAGTFNLHRKFLPQDHSAVLKFNALQEKDNSFTPSMSHAYVFVALDVPISALEKTNLWCFQPSGDDANDIDGAFDRYFEDPATERPPAVYITVCASQLKPFSVLGTRPTHASQTLFRSDPLPSPIFN
jgi:all-trans-retinol 13,14-reductase